MKTLRTIFVVIALCTSTVSNAQLWKKVKQKVAETVERKTEEKTERETEKTFDTIFNNKGKLFKNKKVQVTGSYSFTHQYIMEVISEQDTTDITYYLTNEHEYMGSSFTIGKDKRFITVMDLPNSAIHTFMDLNNQRSTNSIKIDLDDLSDTDLDASQFSINPTGQTKKILGYECIEYQITGTQLSGNAWVTQEAGISFQKAFSQLKSKKMNLSKGIDQSWLSMVDGLALETSMIDYSAKNPKRIKMICTDLSEQYFSIDTAEYKN